MSKVVPATDLRTWADLTCRYLRKGLFRGVRFCRPLSPIPLNDWGEGYALKELMPNQGDRAQLGLLERLCASPGMARATLVSASRLDVTDLLGSIDVPTLIVHAKGDLVPFQNARLLARRIPRARLLEVEGVDHAPWFSLDPPFLCCVGASAG